MTDDELEIFWGDLTAEAQEKVKKFLKIKAPEELNLDVIPRFILPKPEHNDKATAKYYYQGTYRL
jgi:hypothetical protein